MSAIFDELTRITKINAWIATGDTRHLEGVPPPVGFNDPVHLPQPVEPDPVEFNEWDDQQMRECCGRLAKPIQALLQAFSTLTPGDRLYDELKALREAVKAEWSDL